MWRMPFRTCIFSTYIRGASENNVQKNFELLLSLNLMSHDGNYACDIMYYNITHAWRHVFLWCSMYVPQPLGKEIVNHHLSMPACSIINQELYSASVLWFYCVCECQDLLKMTGRTPGMKRGELAVLSSFEGLNCLNTALLGKTLHCSKCPICVPSVTRQTRHQTVFSKGFQPRNCAVYRRMTQK